YRVPAVSALPESASDSPVARDCGNFKLRSTDSRRITRPVATTRSFGSCSRTECNQPENRCLRPSKEALSGAQPEVPGANQSWNVGSSSFLSQLADVRLLRFRKLIVEARATWNAEFVGSMDLFNRVH